MRAGISPGETQAPGGFCEHAVPGDRLQFRSGFKNSHSMNVSLFFTGDCGLGDLLCGWNRAGVYPGLKAQVVGCFLPVTMSCPI